MSRRKIHIGNLQIRLPRGAAAQAREIAGGLGKDILRTIAESTSGRTGVKRIGQIGKIKFGSGAGAGELQKQVARRVADELRKKLG